MHRNKVKGQTNMWMNIYHKLINSNKFYMFQKKKNSFFTPKEFDKWAPMNWWPKLVYKIFIQNWILLIISWFSSLASAIPVIPRNPLDPSSKQKKKKKNLYQNCSV